METSGKITWKVDQDTVQTAYWVYGDLSTAAIPLIVLHGGPGSPHGYVQPLAQLAQRGPHSAVIMYDQLGCGQSTHLAHKPAAFWTVELFMDELEHVLAHFGVGGDTRFALLGHSWGGMLAATYAARRRPANLHRLVISDSPASMALWVEGCAQLLAQFPAGFRALLASHEAAGTTESKEYQDALQVFYKKHLCRLEVWPETVEQSFAELAKDPTVYMTMNGPSEFTITGSLKTWTIVDELHHITAPTLVLNGRFDEARNLAVAPFFTHIRGPVKWVEFAESSHMPFYEEQERYLEVVAEFLAQ